MTGILHVKPVLDKCTCDVTGIPKKEIAEQKAIT